MEELYAALALYGGIALAGILISIALILVALGIKNRVTKKTVVKELYDEKSRKNGQHKGGARGKF